MSLVLSVLIGCGSPAEPPGHEGMPGMPGAPTAEHEETPNGGARPVVEVAPEAVQVLAIRSEPATSGEVGLPRRAPAQIRSP